MIFCLGTSTLILITKMKFLSLGQSKRTRLPFMLNPVVITEIMEKGGRKVPVFPLMDEDLTFI